MDDMWTKTLTIIADTAYDVIYQNYDKLKTNYKVYSRLTDYANKYNRDKDDPVARLEFIIYVLKRMKDDQADNKECGILEMRFAESYSPRFSTWIIDHILNYRKITQDLLDIFVLNYKKYKNFYERSNKG